MNLFRYTDDEIRIYCKQTIESLEFWLKRIIHDKLSQDFGDDYLNAKNDKDEYVIKNHIREKIKQMYDAEPSRYTRLIDASTLDQLVCIICNPVLYKKYFNSTLIHAFPNGREVAKTYLDNLITPRNCLYHANPISVRVAEQVICYSHDIIDSFKEYYKMVNQNKYFNVPSVIKSVDSFGYVFYPNDNINSYDLSANPNYFLRPGELLKIELEVDPTFNPDEYKFEWSINGISYGNKNMLYLEIKESHVKDMLIISCNIITNNNWHKYNGFDYNFYCIYKIIPLI